MLAQTRSFNHITPVLASIHWLPIHFRIDFKILLLTYQTLHGLAPKYLAELLRPYEQTAFAVKAPILWNSLPMDSRSTKSVSVFKSYLKTYLYILALCEFFVFADLYFF